MMLELTLPYLLVVSDSFVFFFCSQSNTIKYQCELNLQLEKNALDLVMGNPSVARALATTIGDDTFNKVVRQRSPLAKGIVGGNNLDFNALSPHQSFQLDRPDSPLSQASSNDSNESNDSNASFVRVPPPLPSSVVQVPRR
jgi:hypothetical protein